MRRHLILRGVDRRLVKRLRDRAARLGLGPGELARAVLIVHMAQPAVSVTEAKQHKRIPR
jgi:hypothetical protein